MRTKYLELDEENILGVGNGLLGRAVKQYGMHIDRHAARMSHTSLDCNSGIYIPLSRRRGLLSCGQCCIRHRSSFFTIFPLRFPTQRGRVEATVVLQWERSRYYRYQRRKSRSRHHLGQSAAQLNPSSSLFLAEFLYSGDRMSRSRRQRPRKWRWRQGRG